MSMEMLQKNLHERKQIIGVWKNTMASKLLHFVVHRKLKKKDGHFINIAACVHLERRSRTQQKNAAFGSYKNWPPNLLQTSRTPQKKKKTSTFQLESKTIITCRGVFFKELHTPAFNLSRWGTIFLWPERTQLGGSAKSLSEMTNTFTRVTFVHTSV